MHSPALGQLEALVANVPGVVYRCAIDATWTMHFVSEQMAELCGHPAEDFVGNRVRTFESIIHPDDREHVARTVEEATRRGTAFVIEYRIRRADGGIRWVMERGREVTAGAERWLDGVILDVSAQHDAEERLRRSMARQAAMEERGRIARDLHDSVSQALFSMSLQARAAQLAAERTGAVDGPITRAVGELLTLANGALAEMRALIFELRPGALQEEGLVAAVRKHAAAVAAREEVPVAVSAPERVMLAPDVEEALYRIVQEALANAVRHARPEALTVEVATRGDLVEVQVCDDGVGFDAAVDRPGHYGLHTMRERAEGIGGDLAVRTAPGGGTTVVVTAPAQPSTLAR